MSRFREPFNGISHLIAACFALVGLGLLVHKTWDQEAPRRISVAVYGASLTLMMAASAAYHSIVCRPERVRRLRKLDHAAIYILIAGTYTPVCYNLFDGFWRFGALSIVWTAAVIGVAVNMFHISKSDWVSVIVYLAMSWLAVFGIFEILKILPVGALAWLFAGGAFYTMGAMIYAGRKFDFKPGVFGHHEIWHLFVTAAAACHFMLIWFYVA
jgi:hemolysin III